MSVEKARFAASASNEPTRSPNRPMTATCTEPASPATSASPAGRSRNTSRNMPRRYTLNHSVDEGRKERR